MVYMFLANGFEETEAICPLDILRRAKIQVTTVGVGGNDIIRGSHGLIVQADIPDTMYRDSKPDMIILPGGKVGTDNLDASVIVDAAIRAADCKNAYVAAICAAPSVLGKRGLLKGKHAVCYPGFEKFLEGYIPTPDTRVAIDGNIITSLGMGSAEEFGFALVGLLAGQDRAEEIRSQILAR